MKRAEPKTDFPSPCTTELRAERLFLKIKPGQSLLLQYAPMGNLLVASPSVWVLIRYFYCFKLDGVIWQVFVR
jgi:hypothetical protein